MATYVPGVGSYLPEFKPFTPDYKFLSDVLDVKTTKYETNYKELNDLYGQVVHGNLSRKDTKEMRDQYAENLGPKLQQISGMDLSMMQNVESAKALFRPFFEHDLIVKDLVTTRKYRDEMQYADMLKQSDIKEERDKYWQTGVQKMQYEMEDFVNASEDKALGMQMPQYVQNSNLYENAMAILKESELGTDVVTTISDNGEWLIHRKNGDLITNQALRLVQKAMKDDPRVISAYHAKSFVDSRNHAAKGIEEGRFANIDQGQADWARNTITTVEAEIEERRKALEAKKLEQENKNKSWKKVKDQSGIIKGSKEEKELKKSQSDLDVINDALAEMNVTLNNKPEAELNLETTGEYKPEDTKSLLYRAYSLIMNRDMETDLQAAAIDYSNIGKMSKLEANEYAVMQKKHVYNVKEEAMKHANRMKEIDRRAAHQKELEIFKQKLEQQNNQIADALSASESTGEINTMQGVSQNKDGKFTLEEDADFMKSNLDNLAGRQDKLDASKVGLILDMATEIEGEGNDGSGTFELKLNDGTVLSGSSSDLQSQLLDPNGGVKEQYVKALNAKYEENVKILKNLDPSVNSLEGGQGAFMLSTETGRMKYAQLKDQYLTINSEEAALQQITNGLFRTSSENLKLAMNTSYDVSKGDEFNAMLKQASANNIPLKYYQDSDGSYKQHTAESFRDAYWEWIEGGGGNGISVEGIDADGFDDSSWLKHHSYEHSQLGDGTMADLGQGKEEETYAAYSGTSGGGISSVGISTGTDSFDNIGYRIKSGANSFINNRRRSDKQADVIFNMMGRLNNLTMRDKIDLSLNKENAKLENRNLTDAKAMQLYDVKQALRGIDRSKMNPGELVNTVTSEFMLDPLNMSEGGLEQLVLVNEIVKTDPNMKGLFLAPTSFNKLQQEDVGLFNVQDDDSEILDPGDELKEEQFSLGQTVYNQYIMDLKKRQTTDSKSQTAYPIATLKYYQSWTSDADQMNSPYSGYTITLSDDYMASLRKKGGILEGKEDFGNVINVVIDREQSDKNPLQYGKMNFSSVATEISASEDNAFRENIPLGGSMSITQKNTGQYNIRYDVAQWDNKNHQFTMQSFSEDLFDPNGSPITQDNRRLLDYYMNEYLLRLEQIGNHNNKLVKDYLASNPDMKVQENQDNWFRENSPDFAFDDNTYSP